MAVVATLLLLGTAGGFLVLLGIAIVRRRPPYALAAVSLLAGYAALLLTVALFSRERVIIVGEPKKFCAADCDLQLSLDRSERRSDGYAVQVRVQSTAARVTMKPDHPVAFLFDEQGRRYAGSDELDPEPFARRVGPGESYTKTLFFHLPPDVQNPRLFLGEGGWVTRFLIGDENSFLHKKTLIRLDGIKSGA